MEDDEGFYKVRFTDEALEDLRQSMPDLPPGDEIMLKMKKPDKCDYCGEPMSGDIGGIEPVGITEDGEVVGVYICEPCMEKGK